MVWSEVPLVQDLVLFKACQFFGFWRYFRVCRGPGRIGVLVDQDW